MSFTIGNIKVENNLILAPMAGVTDNPFRTICRKFGAGIVYTEFVSSNGIIRKNEKTLNMIKFTSDERPIGIQIFGEDPDIVGQSAKYIEEHFQPDIIDINFGCPVPKVTKKGAGSGAMKNLDLMEKITTSVIKSVNNTPVTVKMRAGWADNNLVFLEAGHMLQDVGVSAITLHARTTKQQFTGKANWDYIRQLKNEIGIPVIGNGDVKSIDDYYEMMNYTKCDAVMIGRAALGNPWIFSEIRDNNRKQPTKKDISNICSLHLNLLMAYYSEKVSLNLSKKHFGWYLKGFDGASNIRKEIMKSTNIKEVEKIIDRLLKDKHL